MPPVVRGRPRRNDLLATAIACLVIGGGLVLAMFLVTSVPGCAAGYGEPDANGHRAVIIGAKVADVAAAGGRVGAALWEWVGSPEGLLSLAGGTTGIGAIIALARKLFKTGTAAAAATAAKEAGDAAWDEAHADAAHRTAARDAAFDEGVSRASTIKPS